MNNSVINCSIPTEHEALVDVSALTTDRLMQTEENSQTSTLVSTEPPKNSIDINENAFYENLPLSDQRETTNPQSSQPPHQTHHSSSSPIHINAAPQPLHIITRQSFLSKLKLKCLQIDRYLKKNCRYFYHKKCGAILFIQLILLILYCTNLMKGEVTYRLSLGLAFITLFVVYIEFSRVHRERYVLRYQIQTIQAQHSLGVSNSTQERVLARIIREVVMTEAQLNEIRAQLNLIHQNSNSEDSQNNSFQYQQLTDSQLIEQFLAQGNLLRNQIARMQGLTKEEIDEVIPITPYQVRNRGIEEWNQIDEECCTICLEGFKQGDEVRKSSLCSHFFHPSCIEAWVMQKSVCPNCKKELHSLAE